MENKELAAYLDDLARELGVRGVFDLRIIEEIQGHLLDAVEHGQKRGLSLDEAQREAVERFGAASSVAMQFARDRRRRMHKVLLGVALSVGLLIGYVDSRPTWDDTGVTALAIVISCGILGMVGPKRPWLWAVGVGMWIPIFGILSLHNYGSILALGFAFAGAYGGMAFRKMLPVGG